MKWRHVFGCTAAMGLAYLLPFHGLPVVGVLVAILAAYLLALALGSGAVRTLPAALRRSRAIKLRRSWRAALDGSELPAGAPQATPRSVAMVGGSWGRALAGGPVWVHDCNTEFRDSLAWALAAADDVRDAAGEWVVTEHGLCLTMPSSRGVIRLLWGEVRTLTVLRAVRATSRGVYLATADGRTAHLAIEPSAAVHLRTITELLRLARPGRTKSWQTDRAGA